MMRLAWLTDIHLNFLPPHGLNGFFAEIRKAEPEAVLISGDIGESNTAAFYLQLLAKNLDRPIYFVLGNHDFYRGSFAGVHESIRDVCAKYVHLHWLNDSGVVELTRSTALVGHDSWADGRLGDYAGSDILMTDYFVIEDFAPLDKAQRLHLLKRLGDAAAAHLREVLPAALAQHEQVYVLTHVPPFKEGCVYEGRPTRDDFLPHLGCKAVGDVLLEMMLRHPNRQLTVLCGHTHHPVKAQILHNLVVWTGAAEYRKPRVETLLELA